MDISKKFLFVNADNTSGEYDGSKLFPVSSLQGNSGIKPATA